MPDCNPGILGWEPFWGLAISELPYLGFQPAAGSNCSCDLQFMGSRLPVMLLLPVLLLILLLLLLLLLSLLLSLPLLLLMLSVFWVMVTGHVMVLALTSSSLSPGRRRPHHPPCRRRCCCFCHAAAVVADALIVVDIRCPWAFCLLGRYS